MLCKVTHWAGCISANTRPHLAVWSDREIDCCLMHKMQSGGWLYPYGRLKALNVSSLGGKSVSHVSWSKNA